MKIMLDAYVKNTNTNKPKPLKKMTRLQKKIVL